MMENRLGGIAGIHRGGFVMDNVNYGLITNMDWFPNWYSCLIGELWPGAFESGNICRCPGVSSRVQNRGYAYR